MKYLTIFPHNHQIEILKRFSKFPKILQKIHFCSNIEYLGKLLF